MRIVHLLSSGELGGAERVALEILVGLREANPAWTMEVVVPAGGAAHARATELGLRATVIPWNPRLERLGDSMTKRRSTAAVAGRALLALPDTLSYVRRLRAHLRTARAEIVHAHGFKMHVLGTIACPRRASLILHLHDYVGIRPMMSRLLRAIAGFRPTILAISRSVADDARRVLGGRVPIRVVHNAIDVRDWDPAGPTLDLDSAAGFPPAGEGTVRVGLVATMARWKGHEVFLEAMSLLPRELPIRGYVVGGPIYRTDASQYTLDELRDAARDLGVTDRVGFTGFVPDVAAALRGLDIVAHCSTRPEPFGLVILEAMALERAVIVTAVGGAAELLGEGETGFLVSPGDPVALAARIAELARDAARRRAAGVSARGRAQEGFSRRAMCRDVASVYRSAAAGAGPPLEATAKLSVSGS